jgi:hypothetical protein
VAKINGKIAPLPHRWHTSDYFDLCETTYDFPFDNAAYNGKPRGGDKPLWIDDVVHRRQIIFVRQAGLYVVTDRMFSTNRHNYAIRWAFAATAKELPAPLLKGSYGYTNYGFTRAQVTIDPARNAIRTAAPSTANLSIYHFCPQPLKTWPDEGSVFPYLETKCGFEGTGDQIMTSVLYPRSKPENELGSIEALPAGKDITGWKATLPDGTKISYCGAVKEATLNVDDVEIKGQALLVMTTKDGKRSGLALDCSEFKTGWRKSSVPCADFEFDLSSSKPSAFSLLSSVISRQSSAISFIPIYRPLGLVEISPAADCFVDRLEVTMSHPEPDVDIRYTLDGTDPTGASALYQKPVILERNTIVKARAFRKGVTEVPPTFSGTHVSAVMRANYTRDTLWPARKVETTRGFAAAYYEGDFALSLMTLEALRPIKEVAVPGLFDLGQKHTSNNFAFVYSGYLDIPSDGVYNFHAPPELIYPYLDAGYDLRVFVDGKEWYPATRLHNFGAWSVPLAKGKHSFKVSWVDQRPGHAQWAYPDGEVLEKFTIWRGEKPTLEISGPGLAKQPIPVEMLSY